MLSISKDFNNRGILPPPPKYIGLKNCSGIWTGQIIRYVLTQRVLIGVVVGGNTRV